MATLGQLTDVIAAVEGIDRERVHAIARAVREAGLIATRGRGTSAARMTGADAANLLIAVNVADTARGAPEAVELYRRLAARAKTRTTEFGIEFENMILAAQTNTVPEYVADLARFLPKRTRFLWDRFEAQEYRIGIEFNKPVPAIVMSFGRRSLGKPEFVTFDQRGDRAAHVEGGDRIERTTITQRTIFAIGRLLGQK